MNSNEETKTRPSVFARAIHGLRLKYALVSVVFLVLSVGLFHLGGPSAFGWSVFFAILTLILMVLTLFLIHCQSVIGPLEQLTQLIDSLVGKTLESDAPVRVPWSGKDEFACLTASLNGLLEAVQSRSIGLAEENRRLKGLVSSSESELISVDANGFVVSIIHCPETMIPVPGLSVGAPPDGAVWGKEGTCAFRAGLEETMRTGERRNLDLSLRDSGGKVRRIKVSILRPPGATLPLVRLRDQSGVHVDRRVPLSRVAASVSRELSNVFSVIRSIAAHYEQSPSVEVREMVRTANRAIAAGEAQMENLMILGGERRAELRRWCAVDLVDNLRGPIAEVLASSPVEVRFDCSSNLPDLSVDARLLGLAVGLIVRNSLEAFGSVAGKIEIAVRACTLTAEEGTAFVPRLVKRTGVLVTVADNGPGMAPYVLDNIFEPFFSTKANGRGLGLCIAEAVAEAHGGGLRVTSQRGVRTEVSMYLPSVDRTLDEVAEKMRQEFPGGEVLVVDDNKGVLRITAALFRSQKIAAHQADSRVMALQKFTVLSDRLRAVFLDAMLGLEDSSGLLSDMRRLHPEIPIVVVSGYGREEIEGRFAEAPPNGYLLKPYTVAELNQTLSKLSR